METFHCLFCEKQYALEDPSHGSKRQFVCARCGYVSLTEEAADDFEGEKFSASDKLAISITLRNNWERTGRKITPSKMLTLDDFHLMVKQFRPLSPIEKMDYALIQFEKLSKHVGSPLSIDHENDYPLYYCSEPRELSAVCHLLEQSGFIERTGPQQAWDSITAGGYQRLREIASPTRMSRQCFVAMWFAPDMEDVYEKAIKPAIEFVEPGENEARFRAVKIDNVEHTNDINDEIIAQIRRSRFMVCDLTGYRGGVYFEAGFAYGLGLDVVYTCRNDWSKEEILTDASGNEVKALFDGKRNEVPIKKEGIHFDLAHRNRIEWEPGKLGEFRMKLETRIKALFS
jgi:nucleoside 2-deoxyribosyltransferase